jgi:hypothetical protein
VVLLKSDSTRDILAASEVGELAKGVVIGDATSVNTPPRDEGAMTSDACVEMRHGCIDHGGWLPPEAGGGLKSVAPVDATSVELPWLDKKTLSHLLDVEVLLAIVVTIYTITGLSLGWRMWYRSRQRLTQLRKELPIARKKHLEAKAATLKFWEERKIRAAAEEAKKERQLKSKTEENKKEEGFRSKTDE